MVKVCWLQPCRSFRGLSPSARRQCPSVQTCMPRGAFGAPPGQAAANAGSVRRSSIQSPSTGLSPRGPAVSAAVRFGLRNSLTRMENPASMTETAETGSVLVRCGASQNGAPQKLSCVSSTRRIEQAIVDLSVNSLLPGSNHGNNPSAPG